MKRLITLLISFLLATAVWAQTATAPSGTGTSGDPYLIATLDNLYWVTQNSTSWTGKYFKQTADIDASSTSGWDSGKGFLPIGNGTTKFTGSYDGAGFKISGLYINRTTNNIYGQNIGLFGDINTGASIQNVGLPNVNISGYNRVGALIGYCEAGTVANCFSTGTMTGDSNSDTMGGLIGYNKGTIQKCYSTCTINGNYHVGGFVGVNDGSITDCYCTGNVIRPGTAEGAGSFCGGTNVTTYSFVRCFATGKVSVTTGYGVLAFVGTGNYGTVTNCYYDKITNAGITDPQATGAVTRDLQNPALFSAYDFVNTWRINPTENGGFPTLAWQGTTNYAVQPAGNGGSAADPYLITSLQNLYWLHNAAVSGTLYYYKQTADIDASATSGWCNGLGWSSIGIESKPWAGDYDGQNFKITNLYINRPGTKYQGLFGMIGRTTISTFFRNMNLVNVSITSNSNFTGAIAGSNTEAFLFPSVYFMNCSSSGSVTGNDYTGGLFGGSDTNGKLHTMYISQSSSTCSVSGRSCAGGLIGYFLLTASGYSANVLESYFRGTVTASSDYAGGIAGFIYGDSNRTYSSSIGKCYSTGAVTTSGTKGGLVGSSTYVTNTNSYWDTQTSGAATSALGTGLTTAQMKTASSYSTWNINTTLPWSMSPTVNDGYPSFARLNVSTVAVAPSGSGTLADPYLIATFENLYWVSQNSSSWSKYLKQTADIDASVTSTWGNVVGFSPIGNNTTKFTGNYDGGNFKISNLYINMASTSDAYTGLFGYMNTGAVIKNIALINANITGYSYVGALAGGVDAGTISNCYATGTVSGNNMVGGLLGYSNGTVSQCYSGVTTVTGATTYTGGFVGGTGSGSFTDCYTTSNLSVSATGSTAASFCGGAWLGTYSFTRCFATGKINTTSTNSIKGFMNSNGGTMTNCYYNSEVNSAYSDGYAAGWITWQFQDPETFAAYDFTNTWRINPTENNGYPSLLCQGTTNYWVKPSGSGSSVDPYQIATIQNLYWLHSAVMSGNFYYYKQTADIDLAPAASWANSKGWAPIGYGSTTWNGSYDGQNYKISNLYINYSTASGIGLFGWVGKNGFNNYLSNIKLINANVTGYDGVGALIGKTEGVGGTLTITGCSSTGVVSGRTNVGGLMGVHDFYLLGFSLTKSWSSCNVTGSGNFIGGLMGTSGANNPSGSYSYVIENCYARGSVTGAGYVGGFIGAISSNSSNSTASRIYYCYATGAVTAPSNKAGFCYQRQYATISACYYDTQTTGISGSPDGIGKTTAEMKTQSTFSGWDFSTIWKINAGMNDGYPNLGGDPPPTVTAFTPTSAANGATVTITGTDFTGATAVKFGGTNASSFTVVSATSITAVVATGTTGDVSVTTPSGTGTKSGFTFIPAPVISSFSPTSSGNGLTVTLTGTDFTGATAVSFGGTAATSFTVVSATSITAVVGSGASGDVSVTTPGGTGTKSGFTWVAAPGALSYASSPLSLTYGVLMTNASPTVTGTVTSYSINPTLPTGLSFNTSNGVISGTPTMTSAQTDYTVTATNAGGTGTATVTITIGKKPLTITGVTAANREYDGTLTATLSGGTASGVVSGDNITVTAGTGAFADKNIGTGKTVTASGYSIGGTSAGNYTLSAQPTGITANITQRSLTVTGATADNKVYDGATTATFTGGTLNNIVGTENVTLVALFGNFNNKNVGTAKAVDVSSYSLGGTAFANYKINPLPTGLTANITAKELTVSGATTADKVYDGTTAASLTGGSLVGIIGADVVNLTQAANFADKNAGTAKAITGNCTISGTGASNYTVAQPTLTARDITAKTLTVTATGVNKVYDGNTTATVTLSDNRVSGDVLTTSYTTATFPDKEKGTGKAVSVSGISISGTDAANYTFNTTASTTADITAKTLTVTPTATSKEYDANTKAAVTLGDDRVSGDELTVSNTSATFDNKNVGTGKTVTVSGVSISGTDAANYSVAATATTTADITAKTLAVTTTATDKVYDGNTTATTALLDDRISGDVLTLDKTSSVFDDKNIGTGKTVTVSGISKSGTDAGNYVLGNVTATTTANVTQRELTITAAGVNKPYDGNTTATVTLSDDRVSGDVLTTSYTTATFPDKEKGTGKTVSVSGISISGTDSGNYTFNTTASATADITSKILTVTPVASNKEYDANTTASVTLGDDREPGDVLTVSNTSAMFDDKNVGTGKTVTVSGISITGTDAANYSVAATATTTADITAKTLTVTTTATDKVYDATNAATTTLLDDRISGDVLTLSKTSSTFDDKNVGTAKTVTVDGISKSGTDAGNYVLGNTTATTTANITQKALTITASGINKQYDGDATATVTLSDNRISGDELTTSYTTATFPDKLIGNGKAVSVSGISIAGTDAANYSFNTTASTTADITIKTLTITATGINKVYDQNNTATVTLSDDRVSGDVFTTSYSSAVYADKVVATGKTVSVSGISISGADIGNYTFNTTATTTADITPKPLNVTATATSKVYDGNTTAAITLADDRIAGDVLTTANTAANFADKNVDTEKEVTVTGISISGTDAVNYAVNETTTTTADITFKILTITGSNGDKVYDGTVNTTATLTDNRVSGDDLTITYTTAKFPDKLVGTAKKVTVSGISMSGDDVQNYMTNNTVKFNANITARPLTVEGVTAADKVYDATTTASLSGGTLSNVVSGDDVILSLGTGAFVDKTAGDSKAITTSGYSISGTSASNYSLSQPASVTAKITAKPVTIENILTSNKVYDGTTVATLSGGTVSGVISGDVVTIVPGTGAFADKAKGTNKPVTASGYSLGGADGANYSLTAQPIAPNADITGILLTITGVTASDKAYDGTAVATLSGGTLEGLMPGDDVSIVAGTGAFSDKNVGASKAVTASLYGITGTDIDNYTLVGAPIVPNAAITPASITISGVTASNKVYDASTTATLSGGTLTGIVGTEEVTLTAGTGSFADKTVGTAKTVTATGYALGGADVANYTLSAQPSGLTADITAAPVTITGVTASNKVYDATTVATLNGGAIDGKITGDDLLITAGTGAFADKKVGTAKSVTATAYALSGTDAANYSLTAQPSGMTADITVATIDINGIAASNKVYDGTTTATLNSGTMAGIQGSDDVTLTAGSATFADKNIGTAIAVTASGFSLGGADATNYVLSGQPSGLTANITAKGLTIDGVTAANKVYDATTVATLSGGTLTGIVGTEEVTLTAGTGSFADKTVGTAKTVTATGYALGGADVANYTLSAQPTGLTADITAAPVTITGVTASNKVYDATTVATLTGGTINGKITGDDLSITAGTGAFADKKVGTAKSVTATAYALSGTDAANYSLTAQPSGLTADITVATIDISGATASNKEYDGTTVATMNSGSMSGVQGSDIVTLQVGSANFADKAIGTAIDVTASGFSLGGADASNYVLSGQPSGLKANITAKQLTIAGVTAANKVYDATNTATLSGGTLTGIVGTENVTLTVGTGSFADKTVGTGKAVTATGYVLGGADVANYTLPAQPTGLTADITAAPVTITGVTASSKVYDATAVATLTGGAIDGKITGDDLSITAGTGAFANKTVGTAKTVTATGYALSGTDAANYSLTAQPSGLTADITVATIDISGVTANNKVYDGTTTATLNSGSMTGILGSDVVTLTAGSASFADKAIGTAKPVTASGFSLGGADAANYVLSGQPSGLTADITAVELVITGVSAANKVYDGTSTASLSGGSLTGVKAGEVVTLIAGTGTFADKTVGTAKAVTATGYTIGGADASNYMLPAQPTGLTADITAAPVTITGVTASSKVYDATTAATLNGGTLNGKITGDDLSITAGTGAFANKAVGTAKAVTATGYALSGTDAANYTLTAQPSGLTADITVANIDITSATVSNKEYDGTTVATMNSGSMTGVLGTDDVTLQTGSASFADKFIGNDKPVTASGFSLGGADASNYVIGGLPSDLKANITPKNLTVTGIIAANKVYDATTTAILSGGTLSGVVGTESVTLTTGTGAFADKGAGTAKTIVTTGYSISGADASNYTLAQPSDVKADITTAPLTIAGVTASNKVYDGTNVATLSGGTLTGVIGTDDVSVTSGTGTFTDKNVGTGKAVIATGFNHSGADGANYHIAVLPTGLTADITVATLDISGATAANKVYDGTTAATMNSGSMTGVLGTDVVTLLAGSASFTDKNIGTAKAVTASGFSLGGADASNYILTGTPTNLKADITIKGLTISGVTAANKVYDGSTDAILTGGTLNGVNGSDVVTIIAGTGSFANKNVDTAISVTVTGYAIGGADVSNYVLSAQPDGITADITKANLTISGVTASNKSYDGTTTAQLSVGVLEGVVSGDDVTLIQGTGSFADRNVGNGKIVTATGYALSGTDAPNYNLSAQPSGLTANITQADNALTITGVTAQNKVYDGTATAILVGGTLNGVKSGDVVTIIPGTGSFGDKSVGSGKSVTATGYALSGANAGNYILAGQPIIANADITPVSLTITGVSAASKVYDATNTVALNGGTLNGIIGSDVVTITAGTGTFADKTVGTAKPVTVSGYGLSGADASNYTLSAQPTGLSANVTPASLNFNVVAFSKVYDGTTAVQLAYGPLSGILNGDAVTLTEGTGQFKDKNVGTTKSVTVTGFGLSGADAGNYSLGAQQLDLTADITPAPLSIIADNKSRTYGSSNPEFTIGFAGFVNNETIAEITVPTITCNAVATSQVGKYDISLSGGSATNYELSLMNGLLEVTKASITVTADNKTRNVGAANPEFTFTYQGFVNNETAAVLQTLPTATTAANSTSPAGEYDIIPVGGSSVNYSFSYANGKLLVEVLTGDLDGDGEIGDKEVTGDKDGDGKVTPPLEVAGDKDGDGKIGDKEITGDKDGDGNIGDKEVTGDKDGDGEIGDKEITGDKDGDGKIGDKEITGDKDGDGNIGDKEVTGDKDGDGKIGDKEITGDKDGDGNIGDKEITGDKDGDGNIGDKEVTGDKDGDGKIGDKEITGDKDGDGNIGDKEITGDKDGDGNIGDKEITGDKDGDGNIGDKEVTGDKDGDGKIGDKEITGDKDGDGKIGDKEITGDKDGDGEIGDKEVTGDKDGDGKIGDKEITGDKDGDGKIGDKEITGDKDGDGKIGDKEITGDKDGDGKIGDKEITGDKDGDGKIGDKEITGDKDGDGKIGDKEITGDKDGDGKIGDKEITGDKDGDGKITPPEITGDKDGDGKIGDKEITGDKDGDGKIGDKEIAGDKDGDGKIGDKEITGDKDGDGKITPPEIAGDKDGDGKITPPEIIGDADGDGEIDGNEVGGDKDGDGKIGNGEIRGDLNGDGTPDVPVISGDSNGDGKIDDSEIAGDTNGDGKIDGNEIAGDTDGDGKITSPEIIGDANGDGHINGDEIAGDRNGNGQIDPTEYRVADPEKDHLNVDHLFSPNGDGINDYWKLHDIEKYGRVYVKIYDRWGTLLYESTNYQNDWDGTSKGKSLPEGAYIYFIKTEKVGDKTGVINIVR